MTPENIRDRVVHKLLPADPEDFRAFHERAMSTARAVHGSGPAAPRTRTLTVGLRPGDPTQVVETTFGYTSAISFIDALGHPWPISDIRIGNSKEFTVVVPGIDHNGKADMTSGLAFNTILVSPNSPFVHTDMLILLRGEDTPIPLLLSDVQNVTDIRVSVKVPKRGPNSPTPILAAEATFGGHEGTGLGGADPIQDVLDGIPPKSAVRLDAHDRLGGDVEAWRIDKFYYIRTTMDLMSPPWLERENGQGGVHVYRMPPLHAFYVADDDGNLHLVTLTPEKDTALLETR